ncbi:MAG: benzoylformate decarboxylase [Vulcanimicrobiaceae bacterium]
MPLTVREATVALLRELGMTTVFGNPGSTELRFLNHWPADFRYVTALYEGSAVAMADAYAQLTGRPALVSVHSAGGLGNALGTLFTASRNYAPLVVLAGQQTRAMLPGDPFLYAKDAALFPRPYVKWSVEPARAADVPRAIAHAYALAASHPFGPTFVSVPEDDWDAEAAPFAARRVVDEPLGDVTALDALADALGGARSPVLVVGAGVDRDGAAEAVVELAERLAVPVWASALASRCGFPEDHRLFAGALARTRQRVRETLAPHDLVVVLGAPVFNYHVPTNGDYVVLGTTVYQLTDDPEAAAAASVGTAIVTALRPALARLLARVKPSRRSAPARRSPPPVDASATISVATLLATLAEVLPREAIVVEEAPSTHTTLHDVLPLRPGAFLTSGSGSLGYGLPAAIGAALAAPGRRVLALIGDGSVHYGIQALWNAAQLHLPIAFVIVNNGGYGAMRSFSELLGFVGTPSMAVGGIDYLALAQGYGLRGVRVAERGQLRAALEEALHTDGPVLVDVIVDEKAEKLY